MESNLNIAYKELKAEVGTFLGYGRDADYSQTAYTTEQVNVLDGVLKSGLRCFYYPILPDGGSYEWSFMRPIASIALANAGSTAVLPEDFGGFEGNITILTSSTTSQPWPLEWRNEAVLREAYSATPDASGPPRWVAQRQLKGTSMHGSSRFELFIFPKADQAYTLQGQYYINPDFLSGNFPYAYGGPQHAETLLESCLAIAEQRLDDSMTVHSAKFQERLMASVAMDRRNKPGKLGYNGDRSDDMGKVLRHGWVPAATYAGASYD